MTELVRFGVSLDKDLLVKFDRLIGKKSYTNRSEAFRDLIRQELKEPRAQVAAIGPAGEHRVFTASIEQSRSSASRLGGGAVMGDKKIKAVIPGGSSTMILRGEQLEGVCMDADSLKAAGSSVGTAGLIVMDEDTDLIQVITRISKFYYHESCGQCTPCREGTGWLWKILTRFEKGEGRPEDIDLLMDIADHIEGTTICALGDAAAWPVQSMIRRFRDEFEKRVKAAPIGVQTVAP